MLLVIDFDLLFRMHSRTVSLTLLVTYVPILLRHDVATVDSSCK